MRNTRRPLSVFATGYWILATGFLGALAGCTHNAATRQPTTQPATARERQDAAMRDPFGYSPDAEDTDISGGGLTDFDRGGFK